MTSFHQNNFAISIEKQSPGKITKQSFPLRYGKYTEIRTSEYEFVFNLNGEIKFIRGLHAKWPHPAEQLKRTQGNDWVYYCVGDESGDKGIVSWLGEYYLPCLPYPSNSIWDIDYLSNPDVMNAFAAWSQLFADLHGSGNGIHPRAKAFINRIINHDERVLHERSKKLDAIIGGQVSVLPPDTRHVDYEIIPLMIADGCLYRCSFCCVKSGQKFRPRSKADILEQIQQLKVYFGRNLENYNALFLGNHDALAAGSDLICLAAGEAIKGFGLTTSGANTLCLFMFASVDSLLKSKNALFEKLERLPFYTYINIGFESVDAPTLKSIRKSVEASRVSEAFQKMLEINTTYKNIEITGNFLMGEQLPSEHYQSLTELFRGAPVSSNGKGTIYMSPLKDSPKKRELLPKFLEIANQSPMSTFIYLIQRL